MTLPLKLWFVIAALSFLVNFGSNEVRADVVVFDEDDPVGAGYYDASVPVVTAPSQMTLASTANGGKMLILTNVAYLC